MHIIFDNEQLPELQQKYTVLELDTMRIGPGGVIRKAYCVIENIPIMEMAQAENFKELHANLISNYGKRDWNYCEQAIEHLMGKWGGELDTFYIALKTRIDQLRTLNLDDSWSPIIVRE